MIDRATAMTLRRFPIIGLLVLGVVAQAGVAVPAAAVGASGDAFAATVEDAAIPVGGMALSEAGYSAQPADWAIEEHRALVMLKDPSIWDQIRSLWSTGNLVDVIARGEVAVEEAGALVVASTDETESVLASVGSADLLQSLERLDEVESVELAERLSFPGVATRPVGTTPGLSPWGLDRFDQISPTLDGLYRHSTSGEGVTTYILDSGIDYRNTAEFPAYRTEALGVWGSALDCDGHGTHVAGTVAGQTYGVASDARIVSVKLPGWYSDPCSDFDSVDLYFGIEDVLEHHRLAGRPPAVVNMSIGGNASSFIDSAVSSLRRAGITVVVAAGNDGGDACNSSPARSSSAITVGATGRDDARTPWSSYGRCVDVFAPGEDIISAQVGSSSPVSYDGTSMASPHVAGLAARYLEANGRTSPSRVARAIESGALSVVSNEGARSPRLLANALFLEGSGPQSIRGPRMTNLRVGQEFAGRLTVRGNSLPVNLSVVPEFPLPEGLELSSEGVISGVVSQYGSGLTVIHAEDEWGRSTVLEMNWQSIGVPDLEALSSTVSPGNQRLSVSYTYDMDAFARGADVRRVQVRAVPEGSSRGRACTVSLRGGVLASSCDVTRLANEVPHSVEIRAQNRAGWSEWFVVAADLADRTPVPVAPDEVRNVRVKARPNLVQVQWSPPRNDGGVDPTYTVQWSPADVVNWQLIDQCTDLPSRQRRCDWDDFSTDDGELIFRVQAANGQGEAEWVSSGRVTPYRSPDGESLANHVTVVPGNLEITADWSEVALSDFARGADVRRVQVRAVPEGSSRGRACTVSLRGGVLASSCDVTRLANEVPHSVEIRAQNRAGWSEWFVVAADLADRTPGDVEFPTFTEAPAIEGNLELGGEMSLALGQVRGTPEPDVQTVWFLCASAEVAASPATAEECEELATDTTSVSLESESTGKFVATQVILRNALGAVESVLVSDSVVQSPPVAAGDNAVLGDSTRLGSLVAATTLGWTASPAISEFNFQWVRCGSSVVGGTTTMPEDCEQIAGETNPTYRVSELDIGKFVTSRVTATNPLGSSSVMLVSPNPVILAVYPPADPPEIRGITQQGQVLRALSDGWGPDNVELEYQWYRSDLPVVSNGAEYTLSAQDVSHGIRVEVTGSIDGAEPETLSSEWTSRVQLSSTSIGVPEVSGALLVGESLVGVPGDWSDTATLKYRWLRDGEPVTAEAQFGEDGRATYSLTEADKGAEISLRVTAYVRSFAVGASDSVPSGVVSGGIELLGSPVVVGDFEPDGVVEVSGDSWSGTGQLTYSYQWYRCFSQPGAEFVGRDVDVPSDCLVVEGATDRSFMQTVDEHAHYLLARVGVSDAVASATLNVASSEVTVNPQPVGHPWVEIGSGVASPEEVGSGAVLVTFDATDAEGCCSGAGVYVKSLSGELMTYPLATQVSGSSTAGSFEAVVEVGTEWDPGLYPVYAQVNDNDGWFSHLVLIGVINVV